MTAAIAYGTPGGAWGPPQVVQLGSTEHAISSDVALLDDGSVAVGPDADALRGSEDHRFVPRVIDRVGDPIAVAAGDERITGQDLVAQIVVWVAQQIADAEQADAQHLTVAVPAGWGAHRRSLLLDALTEAGLPDASLVSEPEAAAARYVDRNGWTGPVTLAVVGIGASALRTAVVRMNGDDLTILGVPDGSDSVSGRAFDDAVAKHMAAALNVTLPTFGGAPAGDDPASAQLLDDNSAAELRRLSIEAKELLSIDTHVTIETGPDRPARVRMVRSEFESLIRKPVVASVDALRRTVRSAGLTADDVAAVVLVGGTAQVPLVGETFSTEFGRPVEVDPDPSFAVALGAARLAGEAAGAAIEYEDEPEEAPARRRGLALPWRRPGKPAILVAAACVLALMSAGGLIAATADENSGQSEKRPARSVNLTTSPTPTTDGGLPAAAETSADASAETTEDAAEEARGAGTATGPQAASSSAPRAGSSGAGTTAPAATTPAAVGTITLAGTTANPPPATTSATAPSTPTGGGSTSTSTAPPTTEPTTEPTTSPEPSDPGPTASSAESPPTDPPAGEPTAGEVQADPDLPV